MALEPHNITGPLGTERRVGDVFSYTVGSKPIKQGWLVGLALDGDDKGLAVPITPLAEGSAPAVRFLGQAENQAEPGAQCDVFCGVALLPLPAEEDTSDATLYIGAPAYAWDHATVTVSGKSATMPKAGIIRELDGLNVWVDMKTANA